MDIGAVGVAVGAVLVVLAWLTVRRRRARSSPPTTPAAAVVAGRVRVEGRVATSTPLVSHLTGTPSVWWACTLEEERWDRYSVTAYDGRLGRMRSHTETRLQWHEIDRQSDSLPDVDVVDASGSVRVRLDGARVVERELGGQRAFDGEGAAMLPEGAEYRPLDRRTGRYRQIERGIAVGDEVVVVGEARLDGETGVPALIDDVTVSVSTSTEEPPARTPGN